MISVISKYFDGFGKVFTRNLSSTVPCLMRSEPAGVASIFKEYMVFISIDFTGKRIFRILQKTFFNREMFSGSKELRI
jgi:hypothetical protein